MVQLKRKIKKWLLTKPCYETDEYLGAPLNKTGCCLSSCMCRSFLRQVFNRRRKLNIEIVSLALLFLPLHPPQTELWDLDNDSEDWAVQEKGHFFEHRLSSLFHCMMFLQLVSSFVLLQLWLFDCPLTICSTWKSSLLVRMQQLSSNGHWPLALFWCRLKTFS